MAQVTGLTAERMLEIEASSVVDGGVVGDNLVLTKHDGTIINAGNVRGPSTSESIASDPDTIVKRDPDGDISVRNVDADGDLNASRLRLSATGDASELSTTHAIQIGPDDGYNLILDQNEIMYRSNGTAKRLFVQAGIFTDPVTYPPINPGDTTSKKYVDDLVRGTEIDGPVNLNTLTESGVYTQSLTAQATSGTNYPVGLAGLLEVVNNGNNLTWQTYTPFGDYGSTLYKRGRYNSTWSPWYRYDSSVGDDTGWLGASTAGFSGVAGSCSLTSGVVRRKNGIVSLQLSGALTSAMSAGNIANVNLWNIPSGWVPEQQNGTLNAGSAGSAFTAYVGSSGLVVMSNNLLAKSAGEGILAVGTYML